MGGGYIVTYPVMSIIYLGVFILLYSAFRYKDYEVIGFGKDLICHLISYIVLYTLANLIEGTSIKSFLSGQVIDYLYM